MDILRHNWYRFLKWSSRLSDYRICRACERMTTVHMLGLVVLQVELARRSELKHSVELYNLEWKNLDCQLELL